MKMNKKHMHRAIMHTLLQYYDTKALGQRVVSAVDDIGKGSVEFQSSRHDGFVLRCDEQVAEKTIEKGITNAILDMLDERSDDVLDYIADTYDFVYDRDTVKDDDFIGDIFDFSKSGRLFYVEIDM